MLNIVIFISGHLVQIINGLQLSDLYQGYRLKSSSYAINENMGVFYCAKTCGLSTDCHSFNYVFSHLRCILNFATRKGADGLLFQPEAGYIYGDSSDVVGDAALMGACQDHNCPVHTTCVILSSGGTHCSMSECGPPPVVSGTLTVNAPIPIASFFTYTCDSGYSSSPLWIQCLPSGNLTVRDIKCEERCPVPPKITNATVVGIGRNVGDNKTYVCENGTTVHGEARIMCLEGAVWSTTSLVCEPDCKGAEADTGTTPVGVDYARFGEFILYQCKPGYDYDSGDHRRFCGTAGQWLPVNMTCSAPQN